MVLAGDARRASGVPPGTTIIDATHIGDQVIEEAPVNLRAASYRGHEFWIDPMEKPLQTFHAPSAVGKTTAALAPAAPNSVERLNGYARPLRSACLHSCGQFVTLSVDAARALATDPHCFDRLTCPKCKGLRPIGEFTWVGAPDQVVGR